MLTALAAASARAADRINLPSVTRVTLGNGIRVVAMEYRRAPTLTVMAEFPGGASVEPGGKAGVASLAAALLRRGTDAHTAPQIADEIDFLGGAIGASAGADRLVASLSVLSKDTDAGLDLLAEILRRPTFPEAELERERQLALAGLQALPEDPGAIADRVAEAVVFAGHPYGVDATMTSVRAITRDDVLAYYHSYVVPNRMILVVVGDFATQPMLTKLKARFEDWPKGTEGSLTVPPVEPGKPAVVLIDKPDATQTQARLVRTAFARSSPDYMPARIADTILGGGFTSRLTDEVRVNRKLTYGIGSSFDTMLHGGDFTVSSFTKIETTRALIDATRQVLAKAAGQGFAPTELQKVKGYMAGLFAIRVQTPEALASQLGDIAFYGLPEDYLRTYITRLRAVTPEQANRVARAYFAPGGMSVVLVAPAQKVRGQLQGLGPVETRTVDSVTK